MKRSVVVVLCALPLFALGAAPQRSATVEIAFVANAGAGVQNIAMTELRHLYVTGRLPSGENLVAITRDAGSGTRNGAMNSIGIDPNWGIGDNVGDKVDNVGGVIVTSLGSNFHANNLGGSGALELSVQNNRLGVGYTGLDGPGRAALDANAGLYEILNIKKDIASNSGPRTTRSL